MQNEVGNETVESLANNFINSSAAVDLKKLRIKKPIIVSRKLDIEAIFLQLERNALNLSKLNSLCISQMKIGGECIAPLAMSIKTLPVLEHLDISATGLNGNGIHILLGTIHRQNCLRSLNLSYNSAK